MIGLVLCGGQSMRMGSDKGTLLANGQTWAGLAQEKLKSLHVPVKFSVNSDQEITYGSLFQKENLVLDNQNLNIGGPLKGILSTHLSAPAEDLFVLACDLVKMDSQLMRKLMNEKNQHNSYEAYVYANDDFYEPLCGIYTAGGLAKIIMLYEHKQLKKHSIQFVLGELTTFQLPILSIDQSYFKNFNSPAELGG